MPTLQPNPDIETARDDGAALLVTNAEGLYAEAAAIGLTTQQQQTKSVTTHSYALFQIGIELLRLAWPQRA
ncbi:MAG: hypothetical protein AB7E55_18395 [Pigmentiphaga sp.]